MSKRTIEIAKWTHRFYYEGEKFIDIVPDSTLQLTFMNIACVEFCELSKKSYNYLKKLLNFSGYVSV